MVGLVEAKDYLAEAAVLEDKLNVFFKGVMVGLVEAKDYLAEAAVLQNN